MREDSADITERMLVKTRLAQCAGSSVACWIALLLGAAGVQAQTGDYNPAADQYVERVPTTSGESADSPSQSSPDRLESSVREELSESGGADARQLEELATSPAYGAPTVGEADAQRATGQKRADRRRATGARAQASPPSPSDDRERETVTAAVDAVGSGSTATTLLAIGLTLITGACIAGLVRRRRTAAGR